MPTNEIPFGRFIATTTLSKIMALARRLKIIQGGSSAAKTISIITIFIDRAQVKYLYPKLSSIVSEHVPHLKRGVIRDFKNVMQAQGYWDDARWNQSDFIYTFETGNQMEFFGADSDSKVKGPRRNGDLFVNECNNIDYETYRQLAIRTEGDIFLDYNPTQEFWVQTEVPKQLEPYDFLIVTYKDNEGVPESIRKEIESHRNDKQFWRVFGEGQMGQAEGLIYPNWKQIDEVPADARIQRRWLDYGYSNDPAAIGAIYKWNDSYVLDEEAYTKGMLNSDIAALLGSFDEKVPIAADSAEPKSNAELQAYGFTILPAHKGADSVRNGIQLVQSQKIYYTKRSLNLAKERRNYYWLIGQDGKPTNEPSPIMNHHMDGVRYGFESLLSTVPEHVKIEQMRRMAQTEARNREGSSTR